MNLNNKKIKNVIIDQYDFVVNLGGNIDHNNKRKTFNSHFVGVKKKEVLKSKKLKGLSK